MTILKRVYISHDKTGKNRPMWRCMFRTFQRSQKKVNQRCNLPVFALCFEKMTTPQLLWITNGQHVLICYDWLIMFRTLVLATHRITIRPWRGRTVLTRSILYSVTDYLVHKYKITFASLLQIKIYSM